MVKVPGTREGLPAIEKLTSEGISINVTLLFSQDMYAQVLEAYIAGLEKLVAGGGDPKKIASVAPSSSAASMSQSTRRSTIRSQRQTIRTPKQSWKFLRARLQ